MLLVALNNLGYTSLNRAMYGDAVQYLEESISLALDLGELQDVAAARCNLALALIQLGRVDEAGRLGAEATMSAIDNDDLILGLACLEVLAAVETERRNLRFAARLLGSAEALRHSLGYELEPVERALHDRTLDRMRSVLSDSELTAGLAAGTAMDLEEAFALIGREFLR
jgi:tetratricopeptide (TPR) repeat protein